MVLKLDIWRKDLASGGALRARCIDLRLLPEMRPRARIYAMYGHPMCVGRGLFVLLLDTGKFRVTGLGLWLWSWHAVA